MTALTYIDQLDRAIRIAGARAALIDDTGTLRYAEPASLTNRFAAALLQRGLAGSIPGTSAND
ncbi:MAG: hypothetical protein ACLPV8_18210 [Steroidobacteraceae bacterium]